MKTVAVIGAGASGMMAALTAAEDKSNRVLLFERQQRAGRKLMATGNGRCNLTNTELTPANYHGGDPSFASFALEAFPPEKTLDFFGSLGLLTVREPSGRVYPLSDQANSVADTLRFACLCSGVELLTSCPVRSVRREGERFRLMTEDQGFIQTIDVAVGGSNRLGAVESLPEKGLGPVGPGFDVDVFVFHFTGFVGFLSGEPLFRALFFRSGRKTATRPSSGV